MTSPTRCAACSAPTRCRSSGTRALQEIGNILTGVVHDRARRPDRAHARAGAAAARDRHARRRRRHRARDVRRPTRDTVLFLQTAISVDGAECAFGFLFVPQDAARRHAAPRARGGMTARGTWCAWPSRRSRANRGDVPRLARPRLLHRPARWSTRRDGVAGLGAHRAAGVPRDRRRRAAPGEVRRHRGAAPDRRSSCGSAPAQRRLEAVLCGGAHMFASDGARVAGARDRRAQRRGDDGGAAGGGIPVRGHRRRHGRLRRAASHRGATSRRRRACSVRRRRPSGSPFGSSRTAIQPMPQ